MKNNNKVNVFRIHHKDNIEIGPYRYCRETKDRELWEVLIKKEPWFRERRHLKDKINDRKVNKFGIASYTLQRPGAYEDPLLRTNIQKTQGRGILFFAFRDMDQLFNWFDDKEELNFLESKNFRVSKLKVNKKDLLEGDKQVIILQ